MDFGHIKIKDGEALTRWVLITLGFIVMTTNLIDCIETNSPVFDYILFVGVLAVFILILLVFQKTWSLILVLGLIGIIGIFDADYPGDLNGNLIFVIWASRLAKPLLIKLLIFCGLIVAVVGAYTINNLHPNGAVSTLLAYVFIYFWDFIIPHLRSENDN